MKDINTQLMASLDRTYRTLRRHPSQRGNQMDRRKLTQMKENVSHRMRETVVQELSAILHSRSKEKGETVSSVSEKRLLSYLRGEPEMWAATMASLEREGVILRRRSKKDWRAFDVSLTEKGWEWADRLKAIKDRQNEEFLKPLTAEERETLLRLLDKLHVAEEMGFVQ